MASLPDQKLDLLRAQLLAYKLKFIDPVGPVDPPQVWEFDVRSYVVLAHAAFEEFYEELALAMLDGIKAGWDTGKKFTVASGLLISAYGSRPSFSKSNGSNEKAIHEYVDEAIKAAERKLKILCSKDNHGAAPKHVRTLLIPVGLNFTPTLGLKNSLVKLAETRGAFAHKGLVTHLLTPEGAKGIVADCLEFAETVVADANARLAELV